VMALVGLGLFRPWAAGADVLQHVITLLEKFCIRAGVVASVTIIPHMHICQSVGLAACLPVKSQ